MKDKYKNFTIPYLVWLLLLVISPIFLMIIFSISTIESFSLYTFKLSDFTFGFNHFETLFDSNFYNVLGRTFLYSSISTILALLIGYPIAYIISNMKSKYKFILLLLFILPMWTNMLLRVQVLNNLMKPNSFLTSLFNISIDLTEYKWLKLIIVMTIVYLPFMIFPIYTVLEKADKSLKEAAGDLGANKYKTFIKVTLPSSYKGIISGITMVFLPCATGFTIPQIVSDGDSSYVMIGQLIERYFIGSSPRFNTGSLISMILLFIVMFSLYLVSRVDEKGETLV